MIIVLNFVSAASYLLVVLLTTSIYSPLVRMTEAEWFSGSLILVLTLVNLLRSNSVTINYNSDSSTRIDNIINASVLLLVINIVGFLIGGGFGLVFEAVGLFDAIDSVYSYSYLFTITLYAYFYNTYSFDKIGSIR
jgi:hypothetical protein